MRCTGRIIEEQKNYFVVDSTSGSCSAVVRGTLRAKRPCVGDIVDLDITNLDTREGIIVRLHDRSTFIQRPPLANMQQCVLVTSLVEPVLDLAALDRILFCAEVHGFIPLIVCNKIDLLPADQRQQLAEYHDLYAASGYPVMSVSARTGDNIDALLEVCRAQRSFLAGPSGAGKTTILSRLFPRRSFRTAPVSAHTQRGVHTTTNISLIAIPGGGYIADTPGFALVTVPVVPAETVISYFPDLACHHGRCRFNNCIHDNEPGCVVRELVANGEIALSRHRHYLELYYEMKEANARYDRPRRRPERQAGARCNSAETENRSPGW